jgi:hypothetical protein
MSGKSPLFAAALLAMLAAVPALAADRATNAPALGASSAKESEETCLQNNRLWGWQLVNPRTLSITDRTQKRFMVRLAGGCVGLTNSIQAIELRGLSDLACVRRGDFVRFVEPTLGRMSCAITSIERVQEKGTHARDQIN